MKSFDVEFIMSEMKDASDERKWEVLRGIRDDLLHESDWTQLSDSPVNKAIWAKYRQELRDLTKKYKTPSRVRFPSPPSE